MQVLEQSKEAIADKPRAKPGPKRKITLEVEEAIAEDLRLEVSHRKIATKMGISPAAVQKIAKKYGIQSGKRTQTEQATRARMVDLKSARTLLSARMLQKANEMLDLMEQKYEVFNFTGLGDFKTRLISRPQSGDMRNFMTAAAVAVDKHVVIAKLDQESDTSASDVDQWLRSVAGGK